MTISDEITKLNTNLTDSYTAVSNKGGTLPASENFDNLPNAINSITELKGETKTVTPTTSQQTITPSSGKNGITQVTVNAVTSAIDNNITAGNIKSGVSILGVNGTVTELNGETRSVSITSASGNTFTPTSGKNGITSITVTPTNQNRTVTPTTSQQTLSVNSGYSGNGTITVNAVTSSIDSDIVAGNIKSGVNILGVTGTLSGANNTSLSITPTTSAQNFTPSSPYTGYSPVNVSAVTSAIDSNIQAQFIRNGVEILGVTGTYGEPLPSPKVACSNSTTWYLTPDGELYGCGSGSNGQQGNGGTSNVTTFTKRADNVKQIACSDYTTWYINSSGELYGCGQGSNGQQGNGSTSNVTTFTKRADNIKQIACSGNTTWYINSSGELYGCGSGSNGQQGSGTSGSSVKISTFTKRADNVVFVACSDNTTWYINADGELYGCGSGSNGQQGSGTSGSSVKISTFTKRADNVVFVACSGNTTWYINSSGELYGCGKNSYGNQGSGDTSNVTTFTKRADNVVFVACSISDTGGAGDNGTWYLNENGELYGCGQGSNGQQGSDDTSNVTTFTKRAENVVQVACSRRTTWYINSSGELYGCGSGSNGQQGNGSTSNVTTFTKRADNIKQIACSGNTTWYINSSGELYGCGQGTLGQQGSGKSGSGADVFTFTKRN